MYIFDLQVLPEIQMIGHTKQIGRWVKSPRISRSNMIIVVRSGECTFTLHDQVCRLAPGDCLFLPSGQEYRAQALDQPCHFYFIHFTIDRAIRSVEPTSLEHLLSHFRHSLLTEPIADICILPQASFQSILLPTRTACGDYRGEIFTLLEKALVDRDHLPIGGKLLITLDVCQILALLTRITLEAQFKPSTGISDHAIPALVQEAMLDIRLHYQSAFRLPELYKRLNVSPQYLIRLFNRALGMTPGKYVTRVRIAAAKDLMRCTNLSGKEIAYEIGLDNPHYFSRLFKKSEGLTPQAFKKSLASPPS